MSFERYQRHYSMCIQSRRVIMWCFNVEIHEIIIHSLWGFCLRGYRWQWTIVFPSYFGIDECSDRCSCFVCNSSKHAPVVFLAYLNIGVVAHLSVDITTFSGWPKRTWWKWRRMKKKHKLLPQSQRRMTTRLSQNRLPLPQLAASLDPAAPHSTHPDCHDRVEWVVNTECNRIAPNVGIHIRSKDCECCSRCLPLSFRAQSSRASHPVEIFLYPRNILEVYVLIHG